MNERKKLWISMSVALLGSSAVAADQDLGLGPGAVASAVVQDSAKSAGEGEGESSQLYAGEGEGEGEGEGASPVDINTDAPAYLTRLGLIRGHLMAGYTLYSQGRADMARTHMKHPRDELYAGLVPAIEHRGGRAFDEQLMALATLVESGAEQAQVETAYEALVEAIRAAEDAADASLSEELLSVMGLLRTAGEEYAIGVEDGRLVNAHEYQDAWGFTQIAMKRLGELPQDLRDQAPDVVERVESIIGDLSELWPELVPGETVEGEASRLYGAAARVELAALGLE
jgi:hypothetical protein